MADSGGDEGGPSLLVVVVDINPNQLLFARKPNSLSQLLNCVLCLINSHLMLEPRHRAALVAAHAAGCSFLFPSAEVKEEGKLLRQQDGQYEEFAVVEAVVRRRVAQVIAADEGGGHGRSNESLLAGAMAMALAHVNRQQAAAPAGSKVSARMLVLSASGDSAAQYMNYMNVFFTAQKLNIPVDVCMIGQDSGLLQQGSDITGGLYIKVTQLGELLQYLTWLFLPGPTVRKMLGAPPPVKVDYRAACFCHRQLVDVGYVCSVCLSIFCKFNPVCTTCHSVFKAPGLPPMKKKKMVEAGKK